ncbi:MAG: protein TolR [Alphaproteobacteria bacterium]|nr:protein TolR [Alphaproteobacteria bacterium]
MAISMSGGSGGMRGSKMRRRMYTPMSEINVTPFVDVMLVLLIIFMVAAPLMNVGVPVDLPKTSADPIAGQDEPLVVTIDARGDIYLSETKYTAEELVEKLRALQKEKPDQRIFVRGDKKIDYGKVMEVLGVLRAAGFVKAGLVGDLSTTPAGAAPSGAPAAAAPAKPPAAPTAPAKK